MGVPTRLKSTLTLTTTCPLRSKLLLDDDFCPIAENMYLLFFFCCGKADD
ncbi:hypothetical protein ACJIZ3_019943 [Penstemon smallii]|uniref:Uncharacterized protein n=1 Tax=Penstemon smallii TaxID=265156 RepID=A0ABD3T2K0_9LAMI